MKYFTIQWWAGGIENQLPAFNAYDAYVEAVKGRLPIDLRRLLEDVSLHDSRLRRLTLMPEMKTLSIDLDGFGHDEGHTSYHDLRLQLNYSGVIAIESFADPDIGLAGPHGYGDLGYDELEVLESGRFQHRMLFSTGIELSVTFAAFALTCEKC